jgi:hypothetical protein
MEGVGLTSVSEALCQPSTDLTHQTDRQAVIPLDAQLHQTDRQAVVPLDVHLEQTDRQAVFPLDPSQAVKPAKRKPSWSYEDINVPAPRDITSSSTNKRTRSNPVNVLEGGNVEKSRLFLPDITVENNISLHLHYIILIATNGRALYIYLCILFSI